MRLQRFGVPPGVARRSNSPGDQRPHCTRLCDASIQRWRARRPSQLVVDPMARGLDRPAGPPDGLRRGRVRHRLREHRRRELAPPHQCRRGRRQQLTPWRSPGRRLRKRLRAWFVETGLQRYDRLSCVAHLCPFRGNPNLVVDPTIPANRPQLPPRLVPTGGQPALAGIDGGYLLVWNDADGGTLLAAAIDDFGVVDAPLGRRVGQITGAAEPTVSSNGKSMLLAWPLVDGGAIEAVELSPQAQPLGGVLSLTAGGGPFARPTIAPMGDDYLITLKPSGGPSFSAVRVQADGGLSPTAVTGPRGDRFCLASNGSSVVLAKEEDGGVTQTFWLDISQPVAPFSAVAVAQNSEGGPGVASNGSGYLAAWFDSLGGTTLRALQFGLDGQPLSAASFEVANLGSLEVVGPVAVASDGSDYLIARADLAGINPITETVHAVRVDPSGALLDTVPITVGTSVATWGYQPPSVAESGGVYLVTWADNQSTFGVRVTSVGQVLDPVPLLLGGALAPYSFASVGAFGGFRMGWQGWQISSLDLLADGGVAFDAGTLPWAPGGMALATDGSEVLVHGSDTSGIVVQRGILVGADFGSLSPLLDLGPGGGVAKSLATFDGRHFVATWSSRPEQSRGRSAGEGGGRWRCRRPDAFRAAVDLHSHQRGLGRVAALTSAGDAKTLLISVVQSPTNPLTQSRLVFQVFDDSALAQGSRCVAAEDCATGYCVDGVCCDSSCGVGGVDCLACSVDAGAAVDGTCGVVPAGRTCRPSFAPCDVAEVCDGVSSVCPADGFADAGTVCWPAHPVSRRPGVRRALAPLPRCGRRDQRDSVLHRPPLPGWSILPKRPMHRRHCGRRGNGLRRSPAVYQWRRL